MFLVLFLALAFLTAGCVCLADGLMVGCGTRRDQRRCAALTLFSVAVIFLLLFLLLQLLFP